MFDERRTEVTGRPIQVHSWKRPTGNIKSSDISTSGDSYLEDKYIYSYRGKKPNSVITRILNPHPCVIKTRKWTRVPTDTGWLWGGWYYHRVTEDAMYVSLYNSQHPQYWQSPHRDEDYQNLIDYAMQKLYAKMKGGQFAGLTNLGELRETITMLRSPLKGLQNLLRHVISRRRGESLQKYLGNLADQWLEIRYGLYPLILTVSDLIDLFNKRLANGGLVIGRTASYPIKERSAEYHTVALKLTPVVCQYLERKSYTLRAHVNLAASLNMKWYDVLGIGPRAILPTALELTTLSFVLDWFYSVQNWIAAIQPSNDFKPRSSSASVVETFRCSATALDFHVLADYHNGGYGGVTFEERKLTRTVNPTLPLLPVGRRDHLSLTHEIDSIALLFGRVKHLLTSKMR